MDSPTPLTVAPIQPVPPVPPAAPVPGPAPTPFIPAAPRPEPMLPPAPPAPTQPVTEPPEPAQAPPSRLVLIALALLFGLIALFVGILIWQRVAPRSAPVLPDFVPGQVETSPDDSLGEDPGLEGDSPDMCTLDAMECPDGTMVGRSGPDCAFICPDGQIYGGAGADDYLLESLDDTSETFSSQSESDSPDDPTTDSSSDDFDLLEDDRPELEFDNTYHNPTYYITYSFPTVLDVRDTKPYPREDILFRHGFFDTDINIDDGYVEASTLPLGELVEKTKQEYPDSGVIELSAAVYNGDSWAHYAFMRGILTHEHIFIERDGKTFHMWSSGLSYRIAHFAEDIRFTQ